MAVTTTAAEQRTGNWTKDAPQRQSHPVSFSSAFLQRRDVPDALIDPYSLLGVLSFTVYIFYILYHKYRMGKEGGPMKSGGGMGSPGGTGGPAALPAGGDSMLFNEDSEENIRYMLDIFTKFLNSAAKVGGQAEKNVTLLESMGYDYYDETTDSAELPTNE